MSKFTINTIRVNRTYVEIPLPVLLMVCFVILTSFANLTPERRLSSRVVRTKYGGLRGSIVTLPNKNLQPVEVFLGMYSRAECSSSTLSPFPHRTLLKNSNPISIKL